MSVQCIVDMCCRHVFVEAKGRCQVSLLSVLFIDPGSSLLPIWLDLLVSEHQEVASLSSQLWEYRCELLGIQIQVFMLQQKLSFHTWSWWEVRMAFRCSWQNGKVHLNKVLQVLFARVKVFHKGEIQGRLQRHAWTQWKACSAGIKNLQKKKNTWLILELDRLWKGLGSHLQGLQVWQERHQSKPSVTAWRDSERKLLPLLVTLMSYFNDLDCHSPPLIVVNFPQSKYYQLTLIHQMTVLAFHLHNEILQSAVAIAQCQLLYLAKEGATNLGAERKTETGILHYHGVACRFL